MTSRRSFFKRLASIVAVVALAPEIAFERKLETHQAITPFWMEASRWSYCRSDAYDEFRNLLLQKLSDGDCARKDAISYEFFWKNEKGS